MLLSSCADYQEKEQKGVWREETRIISGDNVALFIKINDDKADWYLQNKESKICWRARTMTILHDLMIDDDKTSLKIKYEKKKLYVDSLRFQRSSFPRECNG